MKKITISFLTLILALGTCIHLSGCSEANDSTSIKRAKLIGNENIELKKQLEAKDAVIQSKELEIQKQKDLLAQKEQEFADFRTNTGESSLKLMQNVIESNKQIQQLTTENEQLKEKIKQLEAALAEK